jgi:hypothetical protein
VQWLVPPSGGLGYFLGRMWVGYPNFPTTTVGRTKLPAIARGKGMRENRFKGGKHLVHNALPIFGSSGRANIEYLERLAKLGEYLVEAGKIC